MNLAKQIAAKTAEDERRVVSIGVVAARRVSTQLRAKVLHAYTRGETIGVRDVIVRGLYETVLDSMALMHLRGENMQRSLYQPLRLKATDYDRLLKPLANPRKLAALKAKYQADALRIVDDTATKVEITLRKTVTNLVAEGAKTKDGIKALSSKFDDLGLTSKNGYQLETIFRTQSQIAYGAGRWEADQDPDIQDILWGYEYSTIDDDRVRPQHEVLNGTKLPKDDPFWRSFWPPNGYNCRCTAIPVFDAVQIKRPPRYVPGTEDLVQPDPGFAFNAGIALTR